MTKENKVEVQKKYLELQILINQINQVQQQILAIQNQMLELRNLKENIGKIKDIKINSESYVPLSSNILIKAKIIDNNEFLVAVGNNVLVPKTVEETSELVEKQIKEIGDIILELEAQLNELDNKGKEVQDEIMDLSKQ